MSGPGIVLLFLAGTFSAIDWGMSLDPNWSSTIYGAMVITGDALATLAMMIVVAGFLAADRPMSEIATPGRLNDLGNLLLAFVMLWAYMSFCQFLIIWSGNLTEEIPWYLRRTTGRLAVGGPGPDRRSTSSCRSSCCCSARTSGRRLEHRGWLSGFLSCTGSTWSGWSSRPRADPASPRIPWGEILLSWRCDRRDRRNLGRLLHPLVERPAAGAALRPQSDRGTRARRRSLNMADYLPQASTTGRDEAWPRSQHSWW